MTTTMATAIMMVAVVAVKLLCHFPALDPIQESTATSKQSFAIENSGRLKWGAHFIGIAYLGLDKPAFTDVDHYSLTDFVA